MKAWKILIAALLLAGCQAERKTSSKTETDVKPVSVHETADMSEATANRHVLQGTVLERLDAGRYSYLRLSTASGETWAAVLLTDVKAGAEVSIMDPMPMDGFETKTLNRKFDKIVFGTLGQKADSNDQTALRNAHAGVTDSTTTGPIKVQRAGGPDGRTIAEIYAQKDKMKDQNVVVVGKVVKVNANIMGKSWVHLRDGTGDSETRTNDLTVTTRDSASVGDTVTVKGKVSVDRNLGMGYTFSVIIEDAAVMKQ